MLRTIRQGFAGFSRCWAHTHSPHHWQDSFHHRNSASLYRNHKIRKIIKPHVLNIHCMTSKILRIRHRCRYWEFFSPVALRPNAGHVLLILEFLDHTQRRTTVGRTPLDEWSERRRDLYLTTHNTHNKHQCPLWDSNPQSQQASGRRPTP